MKRYKYSINLGLIFGKKKSDRSQYEFQIILFNEKKNVILYFRINFYERIV